MPFTVTMPKLSPTMEKGTIAKWHKAEGEFVDAGDLIVEIATDKATIEYNALDSGWLRRRLLADGSEAAVNEPIAIFTEEESESIDGYAVSAVNTAKIENQAAPQPLKPANEVVTQSPVLSAVTSSPVAETRIIASPLAKRLAVARNIDLRDVVGTGPGKRIMKRDLDGVSSKSEQVKSTAAIQPMFQAGSYVEVSLSPVRQIIAERLQVAKSTIPHFYVQQTINAENLISLREQLKKHEMKVTFNDLIIKGCALALKKHPEVNCGFNTARKTLMQFKTIDISVAVSIADGLITPIIPHVDYKSVFEISELVKILSTKAKEGKLQPHEFQGGSFTISNLGMFGVTSFQAIINPPQAAILSVGAIVDQAIIKDGTIVAGKVLHLTLSVDHRAIDGAVTASFLATLKYVLESPAVLLV